MGNTFLTEVEMEALENRMNGMSPQEQVFAVQFIVFVRETQSTLYPSLSKHFAIVWHSVKLEWYLGNSLPVKASGRWHMSTRLPYPLPNTSFL